MFLPALLSCVVVFRLFMWETGSDLQTKSYFIFLLFFFLSFLLFNIHPWLNSPLRSLLFVHNFFLLVFSLILMTFWFRGSARLHSPVCDMILISFFIQIWPRPANGSPRLNLNKSELSGDGPVGFVIAQFCSIGFAKFFINKFPS